MSHGEINTEIATAPAIALITKRIAIVSTSAITIFFKKSVYINVNKKTEDANNINSKLINDASSNEMINTKLEVMLAC